MPSQAQNEGRRGRDAEQRETSQEEPMETQETQNIRAVGWANNTFWRIAVSLAFAASLFSIYDNSHRVERLESQVCLTVAASREAINSIEYYRTRPEEKAAALADSAETLKRFHCPDPESPVLP